jgi:acetyltransferase-like isoleucine patch superfamily enzyme
MTAVSRGSGRFSRDALAACGSGAVIEDGVLVFHPDQVFLGDDVYVGHRTILNGDSRGELRVDDGTWIGSDCFLHSAGGLRIGRRVGIGPRVAILTSTHAESAPGLAIIDAPLEFAPVVVGDGCDLGIGSILLPGTHLGPGVQVGAGAVVSGHFEGGVVLAGVPARILRRRGVTARD